MKIETHSQNGNGKNKLWSKEAIMKVLNNPDRIRLISILNKVKEIDIKEIKFPLDKMIMIIIEGLILDNGNLKLALQSAIDYWDYSSCREFGYRKELSKLEIELHDFKAKYDEHDANLKKQMNELVVKNFHDWVHYQLVIKSLQDKINDLEDIIRKYKGVDTNGY